MSDVDVDEVFVADPGFVANYFEKLSAAQHDSWPRGQGSENVEFGAGQQDQFVVDMYLTGGDVDAQCAEAARR